MRNNSLVLVNKKWRKKIFSFRNLKKKEKLSNKSVLIFLATAFEFFPLRRPHVKTRCHWTRCHWTSPSENYNYEKNSKKRKTHLSRNLGLSYLKRYYTTITPIWVFRNKPLMTVCQQKCRNLASESAYFSIFQRKEHIVELIVFSKKCGTLFYPPLFIELR